MHLPTCMYMPVEHKNTHQSSILEFSNTIQSLASHPLSNDLVSLVGWAYIIHHVLRRWYRIISRSHPSNQPPWQSRSELVLTPQENIEPCHLSPPIVGVQHGECYTSCITFKPQLARGLWGFSCQSIADIQCFITCCHGDNTSIGSQSHAEYSIPTGR